MILQPNQMIVGGKYRVLALLGQGASAEVYLVTHVALESQRAAKVLKLGELGVGSTQFADFGQRFHLEARLGARLHSGRLLEVYDLEEGDPLILILEYASGGSVADRIEFAQETDEVVAVDEAVGIALDVAEGLAVIHDNDVVHRDIKPNNILFDREGRAKLADLGLAQIPHGPSLRSQLSQSLAHPGTPAYMSPEQVSDRDYLTPASDVYSLGLVLFELLSGRVARNQKRGTRVSSLRPDVPAPLDDLISRMLDPNPDHRPFNGADLTDDLRATRIRPLWYPRRAMRPAPSQPPPVAAPAIASPASPTGAGLASQPITPLESTPVEPAPSQPPSTSEKLAAASVWTASEGKAPPGSGTVEQPVVPTPEAVDQAAPAAMPAESAGQGGLSAEAPFAYQRDTGASERPSSRTRNGAPPQASKPFAWRQLAPALALLALLALLFVLFGPRPSALTSAPSASVAYAPTAAPAAKVMTAPPVGGVAATTAVPTMGPPTSTPTGVPTATPTTASAPTPTDVPKAAAPAPAPVIKRFALSPEAVVRGFPDLVRLEWDVEQADTVTIDPGIGTVGFSGWRDIDAPGSTTEYTLLAKGAGGQSAWRKMTVSVEEPRCVVASPQGLRRRTGPGRGYDALETMPVNTALIPVVQSPDGQWVQIRKQQDGGRGWVLTVENGGRLISCNIDLGRLQVADPDSIPPLPTPTPEPTNPPPPPPPPTPMPTNAPPPSAPTPTPTHALPPAPPTPTPTNPPAPIPGWTMIPIPVTIIPPTCRGAEAGGFCWYVGQENASCSAVCAVNGGYSDATRTYAGSGGSASNCRSVLATLNIQPDGFFETAQGGLGCFVIRNTSGRYSGYWDKQPTTADATYAVPGRRRVCACQH